MPPTVVTVQNAGKVATALSNDKCQRILQYLAKHEDATETGLAKALEIPLSTVHYNMKLLVESKLAIPDAYTYSSRGKEIMHYRANKNPIIIVQAEDQFSMLRAVVPAVLVTAGGAMIYQLAHRANLGIDFAGSAMPALADEGARMMAADAAPELMKAAPMMAQAPAVAQVATSNPVPAFILGALSVLIVTYLVILFMRWRSKSDE